MKIRQYVLRSLKELGLSEGEATVFCTLLKSNKPLEVDIIRNAAGLSMSGTYKVVRSLEDQGFIIPQKEGSATRFSAISLNQIAKKMEAKSRKFLRASGKLREIKKLTGISPETDILDGDELTDFYLNIPYKIDDFIWCVGSFAAVMNFFGLEIERDFIRTRVKKGRRADALIFDDSPFSKELAGRDIGEKRETRLIPHSGYPLEFSYLLGDTCMDFYKDPEGRVKVLKTDAPELARARLIQYQTIWNSTAR